ncbi:MAG: metallophosphoesterase family protein [Chloroflexi bacterium]|nr:metallophosphoesterase family protein [Chloroflexota bacterium]
MDQIAIISDLHGNLPALEATLADIRQRNIHLIYCLGDVVGKGPDGAKAVDLCRAACQLVVKGNWDEEVAKATDWPVGLWHQAQLGPERVRYLQQLPNTIDFQLSGKHVRLFHASAQSIYCRVGFWDNQARLQGMFANTEFTTNTYSEPDIVGYGDIHHAFMLPVEGKLLFNAGSVGNPLDQIPLAGYTILKGHLNAPELTSFSLEIVRVAYDIERAIREARAAAMPKLAEYEFELRTANHRNQMFVAG